MRNIHDQNITECSSKHRKLVPNLSIQEFLFVVYFPEDRGSYRLVS